MQRTICTWVTSYQSRKTRSLLVSSFLKMTWKSFHKDFIKDDTNRLVGLRENWCVLYCALCWYEYQEAYNAVLFELAEWKKKEIIYRASECLSLNYHFISWWKSCLPFILDTCIVLQSNFFAISIHVQGLFQGTQKKWPVLFFSKVKVK